MNMTYDNTQVRRQDRLLSEEDARMLLSPAEYGTLSMCDNDCTPYGIPINFVWDGEQSIYLHCAPQGRKIGILKSNSKVSFSIVGAVHLLPNKFTTEYESLVITGSATIVDDDDERREALRMLLAKLSPHDVETGLMYAEKSLHRTAIIRIDICHYSGKAKAVR